MKHSYDNLPQSLMNDAEQLANFYSVEISELVCDCPKEMDINRIEQILIEYRTMILQH